MTDESEVRAGQVPVEPVALGAGDEMPQFDAGPITPTDIVRYAGAGGDFNPIHHDDEFARQAGFPGVFAMGLLQGGMLAQRLARWVGPHNVERLQLRFTGQVWPGDVIEFSGRVDAVEEQDEASAIATCSLSAATDRGGEVIRGEALVRVSPA